MLVDESSHLDFTKVPNVIFSLKKPQSFNRLKRRPKVKKSGLVSRKDRRAANLLRLPKTGWDYDKLEDMRKLWQSYIYDILNNLSDSNAVSLTMDKAEYIGAEIAVVRSTNPNLVGINGTVVTETKNSFQIVTKQSQLKVILKEPCVFKISHPLHELTIFGKRMIIRPSERTSKKRKNLAVPDL